MGSDFCACGHLLAQHHAGTGLCRSGGYSCDCHALTENKTMRAALELTLGNLLSLKHNAFKGFDTLDAWIAEVKKALRS